MTALDLADRPFDLIGAKGAIYSHGFPSDKRATNERAIVDAGSRLIDFFTVQENEWWDDNYTLIEARLEVLRSEPDDVIWQEIIAA